MSEATTSDSRAAIDARDLRKSYGDVVAVDGLDVRAQTGTCLGLLGPNGAGKSTTLHILVGLITDHSGDVTILDRDMRRDGDLVREHIGVQLQETQLYDKLTTLEILQLFRSFYAEGRDPDAVLGLVGLEEKRNARCVHLSGGQKQRLALGCALVSEPRILFLDEPTTGLDPQARRRVWEIVEEFKARGGTVLLTTHYMDEAERLSDSVLIVDHGKAIASGRPEEIIDSLGAESIVEFSADPPLDAETSSLAELPSVKSVRASASGVSMEVESTHIALPALLDAMKREQATLTDLRTHRPTLEDVFVNLTGRQLRDG